MVRLILGVMLVTQATGNNPSAEEKKPAPWEQTWVLKPVQAVTEAIDTAKKAVEGVRMPWERDWKVKAAPTTTPPVKMPTEAVDVSTEAKMKKAAIIQTSEVLPDTRSHQSNIDEIDQELAKTKDEGVRRILLAEKNKFVKLIEKEKVSAKTR